MGNWIFTIKQSEDNNNYYSVGYLTNSVGNYSEVIVSGDVLTAIRLVNILNGGNTTPNEIAEIISSLTSAPQEQREEK